MAEYIDEDGYERGKVNYSDLIHRQVAYHEIYLKNRDKYPLPFSKYVVHHKDKNKRNNHVSNLEILTEKQHNIIHGIIKLTHEEEVNWGKNKKHYDGVVKQHNNPPQEVKEELPVKEERPGDWIEIHPPETKEPVQPLEPVTSQFQRNFFVIALILILIVFMVKTFDSSEVKNEKASVSEPTPVIKPFVVWGSKTDVIIKNNQERNISLNVTYQVLSKWFGVDYQESRVFDVGVNSQKNFKVYYNDGCSTAPCSVSIVSYEEIGQN